MTTTASPNTASPNTTSPNTRSENPTKIVRPATKRRRRRHTAIAALVAAASLLTTVGAADADSGRSGDLATPVTSTTRPEGPGGMKNPGGGDGGTKPIRPGNPILTGRPPQPGTGSDCFVDFDDKSILNILPNHAQATFVEWPFWNQYCGYGDEGNISIRPLDDSHYHLGYEDEQIDFCTDIGNFGRHTEPRPVNPTDDELLDWYFTPCTEIDPVAETRSSIQPHDVGAVTQIFTYESLGDHLPFTLNEIQIVSGTSELCYLPSGPIKAAGPGGSPWDCLELDPGYYDLSGFADDVIEVRVTALTANNQIDNIAADIL